MAINLNGTGSITGLSSISSPTISGGSFPSGDVATPGFSFSGDPNTGMYSPGADQLALSTNGTGRLFVNASGNVGIGAAPTAQFDVAAAVPTVRLTDVGGAGAANCYHELAGTGNGTLKIAADEGNNGSLASNIQVFVDGGEKLRITSAGLVGIGTSAPNAPLMVQGSSQSVIRAYTTDTGTSNQLLFDNASNYHYGAVGTVGGNSTITGDVFGLGYTAVNTTDFTPVLSWTANTGRVGIGTTSPGVTLQISNATENVAKLRVMRSNGDTNYIELGTSGGDSRIVANGISSPSAVNGTLVFARDANTGTPTESARIDSSGRLLVGTSSGVSTGSSVQAALQVVDNSNLHAAFRMNRNDSAGPTIAFGKSRSTSDGGFTIVQANDELGTIRFAGSDGGDIQTQGASIAAYVDGTPGANDMPGRLVFSTTADGASSPTEAMRIGSNGSVTISAGRLGVGDFYIFTASGGLNNGQSLAVTFGSASATHRGQNIFRITYCVHTNNSATLYAASFIVNIKDSVTTGYSLSLTDFQSLYNVGATIGSTADLTFVDNADGTASITFPNKVGAGGNSSNTTAKVTVERICSGFNSAMIPTAATVV